MSRPLRSTPITGASSLLRAGPPARPHRYSTPHSFCCSTRSLSHQRPSQATGSHIGTRLPTFPVVAADQARAVFTPDTTWPVNVFPPDFIPKIYTDLGFDVVSCISMLRRRFALARLPDPCLTTHTPPFPHRSPQRSSANAAWGGLTSPPAGRRRRATKPSSTTQHCFTKIYLHSDLRSAFVAHVHEQVRQDGRDRRALWGSPVSCLQGPVGQLQVGGQPPLHIQHYPAGLGVLLDGLDDQVPPDAVEEPPDVQIDHPVVLPATIPAGSDRIQCRPLRPIAVGVRVEHWFHPCPQMRGHHRLDHPIANGGHA